jgi:hypothetical protein
VDVKRPWRGGLLVVAGLVVGYALGPPLAQAAVSAVHVVYKTNTAHVDSKGHLSVSLGGTYTSTVIADTVLDGELVLTSGTSSSSKSSSSNGLLSGISVDVSAAGTQPVTVALRKGATLGAGTIIWQGTVPANQTGHLDNPFENGIFLLGSGGGYHVDVTNAGGATVQYEVYGVGFGVVPSIVTRSPIRP